MPKGVITHTIGEKGRTVKFMSEKSKIRFLSELDINVSKFTDNVAELEYALPALKKGGFSFAIIRRSDRKFYVARKSVPEDKDFPDIIKKEDHLLEEIIYYHTRSIGRTTKKQLA